MGTWWARMKAWAALHLICSRSEQPKVNSWRLAFKIGTSFSKGDFEEYPIFDTMIIYTLYRLHF